MFTETLTYSPTELNGRMYDPTFSCFLSPDNYIQSPDFSQSFNRYAYCWNNPLRYTDPDGECIISAIVCGAMVGAFFGGVAADQNGRNAIGGMIIGAASGAIDGWVGEAVSGVLSFGGFLGGAVSGAASGAAAGFVNNATTAWVNNASFKDGLLYGLEGAGIGGVSGAVLGGISGGISHYKRNLIFRKGCIELNVNPEDAVSATDEFLSEAQSVWYPDAPMENIDAFTVEKVPIDIQESLTENNACGRVIPISELDNANKLTGKSNVYFNKELAFSSAKQLFYTMGHEFVHVSQIAHMASIGITYSKCVSTEVIEIMDYWAYQYEAQIGKISFLNSFEKETLYRLSQKCSFFYDMNWQKYPWTYNHSYKYPF